MEHLINLEVEIKKMEDKLGIISIPYLEEGQILNPITGQKEWLPGYPGGIVYIPKMEEYKLKKHLEERVVKLEKKLNLTTNTDNKLHDRILIIKQNI